MMSDVRPIEAKTLAALPGIRHGFFTRQGGVSDGLYASLNCGLGSHDGRERVLENRGRVADRLGIGAERLVNLYQVHSATCLKVIEPWAPGEAPKADAMATTQTGLALAVASADCAPVLFADAAAAVVGAAHAGWRGAVSGVLEATVTAMIELGAEPTRIVAAIGPTISGAVYEVGPDFVEEARRADMATERFLKPSGKAGHMLFDLPAYAADRLLRAGIGGVEDLGICTYSNEEDHFSYRRATHRGEADYGRHYSAITLTAS